jgi:hypothetical protein
MAFTDDLRGLSPAEQIARVQAVAREHGDELTEPEAGGALGLYVTIHAHREGPMQPLTVKAADAYTLVAAMKAHGFTVRLSGGPAAPPGGDGAGAEAG